MEIAEFSERWIAERAIALVEKYGKPYSTDSLPGFVQRAELGDFRLMYTTPFSGFSVMPDKQMYMVDIWLGSKVFSCAYQGLQQLSHKRGRRGAWLEQFRTLE